MFVLSSQSEMFVYLNLCEVPSPAQSCRYGISSNPPEVKRWICRTVGLMQQLLVQIFWTLRVDFCPDSCVCVYLVAAVCSGSVFEHFSHSCGSAGAQPSSKCLSCPHLSGLVSTCGGLFRVPVLLFHMQINLNLPNFMTKCHFFFKNVNSCREDLWGEWWNKGLNQNW